MKQRYVLALTFSGLTALVMTQFQNCGSQSIGVATTASGEVRIVDDFNKSELQFVYEEVVVHDEAHSTQVSGLCSRVHNGERVKWALLPGTDPSEKPMSVGEGLCRGGQFNVVLEELDGVVCGEPHTLMVEGDWGAMSKAQLVRRCQPLVSETVNPPEDSPYGTACSLEFSPGNSTDSTCTRVCYREDIVVLMEPVDAGQCSTMAAKLAGP